MEFGFNWKTCRLLTVHVRRRYVLMLVYFNLMLLLRYIALLRMQMRPIVTDRVAWSVCLSVCAWYII